MNTKSAKYFLILLQLLLAKEFNSIEDIYEHIGQNNHEVLQASLELAKANVNKKNVLATYEPMFKYAIDDLDQKDTASYSYTNKIFSGVYLNIYNAYNPNMQKSIFGWEVNLDVTNNLLGVNQDYSMLKNFKLQKKLSEVALEKAKSVIAFSALGYAMMLKNIQYKAEAIHNYNILVKKMYELVKQQLKEEFVQDADLDNIKSLLLKQQNLIRSLQLESQNIELKLKQALNLSTVPNFTDEFYQSGSEYITNLKEQIANQSFKQTFAYMALALTQKIYQQNYTTSKSELFPKVGLSIKSDETKDSIVLGANLEYKPAAIGAYTKKSVAYYDCEKHKVNMEKVATDFSLVQSNLLQSLTNINQQQKANKQATEQKSTYVYKVYDDYLLGKSSLHEFIAAYGQLLEFQLQDVALQNQELNFLMQYMNNFSAK